MTSGTRLVTFEVMAPEETRFITVVIRIAPRNCSFFPPESTLGIGQLDLSLLKLTLRRLGLAGDKVTGEFSPRFSVFQCLA
ncbi:hypothetical protein [Sinorhizobium fredii]|uniref:hypothetical protein n=1 Tax=Rhizobium fredii TaxID=380 RepID=UPI0035152069